MEYLREASVKIDKDTNKCSTAEELKLGEYNDDETMEEFIQRVTKRMREIFLDEYE